MEYKLTQINFPDIKECAWCRTLYEQYKIPPREKEKFYLDDLINLCPDCKKRFYRCLKEEKDTKKKEKEE